ncbi:LIM and senescent cell antigen-like-containing domain protein 1 [Dermacentor silvarum]|uniref:LIM and senescent cell antigen-like-containing domain protein 1 n=1 Tax=Dermacentor silvarum TaxID=543639 RepID=UPI00189C4F77|nr:LIM and senescent cell antigen-like-containing domain protein 1 [Dermacentor silvarum]
MNLSMDSSELYQRRAEQLRRAVQGLSLLESTSDATSDTSGDYANVTATSKGVNANGGAPRKSSGREEEPPPLPPPPPPPPVHLTPLKNAVPSANRASGVTVLPMLDVMACCKCGHGFGPSEQIVNSCGQVWHPECFVCAQCFQRFPGDVYYEFGGRNYCEHDFRVLFMPTCAHCNEGITGRLIRALGRDWHARCLCCRRCGECLSDQGLLSIHRRPYCRKCYNVIQAEYIGKLLCAKCEEVIDENPLRRNGEVYHPYHFNCVKCSVELTSEGREVNGEMHCLKCHDKMVTSVCAACRRPIEDARVACALGKKWHVEHFVCAHCEKPFLGRKHYEKNGHAYCETHFEQLFGFVCFVCNLPSAQGYKSLNKMWCPPHFCCSYCDRPLATKSRFLDVDLRPVCKKCFEKFPSELKKRLLKTTEKSRLPNK